MDEDRHPKPVRWVGSSKADLTQLSLDVKHEVGQALWNIQCGDTPMNTKQLKGKLATVREIIIDEDGETFRIMYTTKLGNFVYVLDVFHKKAEKGIATPQKDVRRVEQRLRDATEHYAENP